MCSIIILSLHYDALKIITQCCSKILVHSLYVEMAKKKFLFLIKKKMRAWKSYSKKSKIKNHAYTLNQIPIEPR